MMRPMVRWKSSAWRGEWRLWLLLGLVLLAQLHAAPDRWQLLRDEWLPVARHWADADAQQRAQVGPRYDQLRAADRLLPPGATVLLVTPGIDTRHGEYIAFHRALSLLAPRPVWWVAPATTERRPQWWQTTPLTPAALAAAAAVRGADFLLLLDVAPGAAPPAPPTDLGGGAWLVGLGGATLAPHEPVPIAAGAGWPWRLAAALGVLLALGGALLALPARAGLLLGWVARLAVAWGLGTGVLSLALFWLLAAGAGLRGALGMVTVGSVAALWLAGPGGAAGRFRAPGRAAWPLLALLGWEVALVALLAVGRPLVYWDAWVTWGMKARLIVLSDGLAPGLWADTSRAVTHLDYPLLLPLLEAWLWGWLGALDERLVGVQAVGFFVALLALVHAGLGQRGVAPGTALAGTAALAALPTFDGLAAFSFADIPLAFFLTLALVFLVGWLEGGPPGTLLIAVAAGGLLPWTKREGLLLLLLLAGGAMLVAPGARGRRAALVLFGVGALAAGPWLLWLWWHGVGNTDFLPLAPASLAAGVARLPGLLWLWAGRLLNPRWALLWPLLGGVALACWRPRRVPADLFLLVPLFYLALLGNSFALSAFVPWQGHLLSAADRLLAHVAPAAILWLARPRGEGAA